MNDWDPAHYGRYADERSRPYGDLVRRIGADRPRRVVDLGCGSGELTASLGRLWPTAEIVGVDSSPAMIEKARTLKGVDDLRFLERDLRDWRPDPGTDVLISNAALQWVPDHRRLLPGLVERLADGGWLAFQVPGNFDEPSHVLLHELAATRTVRGAHRRRAASVGRRAGRVPGRPDRPRLRRRRLGDDLPARAHRRGSRSSPGSPPPGRGRSCRLCPDDLREQFETDYKERLREAYPDAAVRDGAAVPPDLRGGSADRLVILRTTAASASEWHEPLQLQGFGLTLTPLRVEDAADFLAASGTPEERAEVLAHLSYRAPRRTWPTRPRSSKRAVDDQDRIAYGQRLDHHR